MVRPEASEPEPARAGMSAEACRTDLVGGSPTPVGAEAPGSRLPVEGETRRAEAQRQKPLWEGANEQAVTLVNATASSVLQPKGVRESRVAHVTTKATHIDLDSERSVGFPGVWAAACSERAVRNWRGPPRQPASGKDQGYKPGSEVPWSRDGVRGAGSTDEAAPQNAVEGRGLTSVASVEEVSVRACRKASYPFVKARELDRGLWSEGKQGAEASGLTCPEKARRSDVRRGVSGAVALPGETSARRPLESRVREIRTHGLTGGPRKHAGSPVVR